MTGADYTAALACELVATTCCACGRALLDAASVECGMGPTCRRRAGLESSGTGAEWSRVLPLLASVGLAAVDGDARSTANRIVHRIAAEQGAAHVPALLSALELLGFAGVAGAIRDHLRPAAVHVETDDGGRYLVRVEGLDRDAFDAVVTALRAVPGRWYDGARKASVVPQRSRAQLWHALKSSVRPGTAIVGPRGVVAA